MKEVSLKDLLEAGCHFGHQTTRWNPKMRPYIFTARDRIHIFDLVKTKKGLEEAAAFAKATAAKGGQILFVGTKRQVQDLIKDAAVKTGMPYITERWIGGLITNWDMLKKRIKLLADLKTGLAEGKFKDRTKKEILLINRKITKMERIFGGVSNLTGVPAAVFIADAKKEISAVREAIGRNVEIMAILDTNADPDGISYVIPANDDATKCLELLINTITEAIEEGKKEGAKKVVVSEVKEVKEVKEEKVVEAKREEVSLPAGKAGIKKKELKAKTKKETKKEKRPSSAKASSSAKATEDKPEGKTK